MAAMLALSVLLAGEAEIPAGSSEFAVEAHGAKLDVFVYRPEKYTGGSALLVFHGVLRNAGEYRDHARGMADRFNMLVVAPRFAEPEFPKERYQFGGVSVEGKVKPKEYWSGNFVPPILAEVRRRAGNEKLSFSCIGHSGGGQFLARMAGFTPNDSGRVVVANAGTHLFPTRDLPYPFGFGGLPEELSNDSLLKRYVEQPITYYQGDQDLERDEFFDVTPPAEAQGKTRLERGRNVYAAGHALAKKNGWTCRWTIVEVPGVGHDHEKMFDSDKCSQALGIAEAVKKKAGGAQP